MRRWPTLTVALVAAALLAIHRFIAASLALARALLCAVVMNPPHEPDRAGAAHASTSATTVRVTLLERFSRFGYVTT